ncbi:hypothetical protein COT75_03640 [Candidatus Beckwithbacteria bacterium CG10_big_fil_rev_8_21_14_0_10_34_10]|uniref:Uncharacterized protein n=1 Tax=Candidatus Beckwithbacteria bacterium CG10_big_fil_rev_8_21_14_0_10_34_10 TaxID=1974495 RepID=A0A2H0W8P9_9BACT|nr:MAG: hypothetical protein COT75_03640 [Candidatus Beckwithbacteria bacterium CG10_big_fil_rev_8_21_14_0_10_34_10]
MAKRNPVAQIKKDLVELVIERLKASSNELKISVGSKDYTKKELITSVQNQDAVGRQVVRAQQKFLQDMASGKIY